MFIDPGEWNPFGLAFHGCQCCIEILQSFVQFIVDDGGIEFVAIKILQLVRFIDHARHFIFKSSSRSIILAKVEIFETRLGELLNVVGWCDQHDEWFPLSIVHQTEKLGFDLENAHHTRVDDLLYGMFVQSVIISLVFAVAHKIVGTNLSLHPGLVYEVKVDAIGLGETLVACGVDKWLAIVSRPVVDQHSD